MLKTYLRLLGFAKPVGRYAVPYFFYSLLYALFNSCTFLLIIPILNTMFKPDYAIIVYHIEILTLSFSSINFRFTAINNTEIISHTRPDSNDISCSFDFSYYNRNQQNLEYL